MKKLLLLLTILIITLNGLAQYTPQSRYGDKIARMFIDSAIFIPTGCGKPTSIKSVDLNRASIFYDSCGAKFWIYNPKVKLWDTIKGGSGGDAILAGPISSLPTIGFNPGENITSGTFITNVFYQSQPPLASLSGGGMYEYTSAGSTGRSLNWTATRQSATFLISSIVVDGVIQTFVQPAQGSSVSGNKTATVSHNTNTTYSNVVTTTDNKTATATTTFIYQNKIYAGFVSSATPTDGDILNALNGNVGGVFSGSRNQSGSLTAPSSSKFVVFASPLSYGTPNVVINGLGVTYNQTTRSFTNASGGIVSYIIAVSPFSTAGQIDSYIVN